MRPKYKTEGFGYDPLDYYEPFIVNISDKVTVSYGRKCLVVLSMDRWKRVAPTITKRLNKELKEQRLVGGKFTAGETKVQRLLGKEMLPLLWAVEPVQDLELVHRACVEWTRYPREELWQLFQYAYANKSWRYALQFAICDYC